MLRKLIFFDIDGTLLDEEKRLPATTKEAIGKLREAGHVLAIATGRAPFMFKALRDELGIDSFVSLNGQYAVFRNEPFHRNPIPPDVLRAITEDAAASGHPLVYQDEHGMRANVPRHDRIDQGFHSLRMGLPEFDPAYGQGRDIYQTLLFCTEAEEAAYRQKYGVLRFVRWHPVSMDVMPKDGSKAAGIARFMERLGIGIDDVYAFGDYYNDLEMLQFVGHGIAMGGAPDEVKRAAKYVTTDVTEDGILNGLKQVGLL
ncbi:Cof-type HAD-IIB family hydrolase [Paenibacillus humicola]|uniref:Cof-type HAD-IIB family hydrolase n=1 Tax=Paenibacillus humicola TaxID=3110540 RepID=UPI00237AEBF0|nr:Cof-type HAD-IIB family hydrolase [Paenibacillus humicola]